MSGLALLVCMPIFMPTGQYVNSIFLNIEIFRWGKEKEPSVDTKCTPFQMYLRFL